MSGLEDLYREIILDHYRNPRNRGELDVPPAVRTEGFNPLCGDEVVVYVVTDDDGVITDIRIDGTGCSISQSSASMMSEAGTGRTMAELRDLIRSFQSMMSVHEESLDPDAGGAADANGETDLGDLDALRGVVKFPVRIKCATLAWHTLIEALDQIEAGGAA